MLDDDYHPTRIFAYSRSQYDICPLCFFLPAAKPSFFIIEPGVQSHQRPRDVGFGPALQNQACGLNSNLFGALAITDDLQIGISGS
jgi:hypothetical protein